MTEQTVRTGPLEVQSTAFFRRLVPDMPLVIWMVLATLTIALAGGMAPGVAVTTFNDGFGYAIGEFALILLPSFTIAAALSRAGAMPEGAGRFAVMVSPVAGAGMICPDTAYAALSPAAAKRKLEVAFGAYAGFKLLFPAGPLIVATGLGVDSSGLILAGIALTIPVWAAGVLWARFSFRANAASNTQPSLLLDSEVPTVSAQSFSIFLPFAVLALLLGAAPLVGTTNVGWIDFSLQPKGALLAAAVVALLQTASVDRRACLDSAVRRTGSLLLIIGAASAFGAVLTTVVSVESLMPTSSGWTAVLGLFALTVVFKLIQGSSMATFAAIAPVAAPAVLASGVDPMIAVFAICIGSFVAILPNDSFYWLVRRDAMADEVAEGRVLRILAGGAVIQALTGLGLLLAAMAVLS